MIKFIVEAIDKLGHGHIRASLDGVAGLGIIAPETDLPGMVHIELRTDQSAMGCREARRNDATLDAGNSTLQLCRIGDIKVIGDTAVLLIHEIILIEKSLHLIAVTIIISLKAENYILSGLIVIRTFGVQVIDRCTQSDASVHITRKLGFQPVGLVGLRTAEVIAQLRPRDVDVIEFLFVERREPVKQGIAEHKRHLLRTVEKDHVYPLAAQLSGRGPGITVECRYKLPLVVIQEGIDFCRDM